MLKRVDPDRGSVSADGFPLKGHANPFHDSTRNYVRRLIAADDAVEADALEGFISNRQRALGRISLAPNRRAQPPANLNLVLVGDLGRFRTNEVEPNEPNPHAGFPQGRRPPSEAMLPPVIELAREDLIGAFPRPGAAIADVTHDSRIGTKDSEGFSPGLTPRLE